MADTKVSQIIHKYYGAVNVKKKSEESRRGRGMGRGATV